MISPARMVVATQLFECGLISSSAGLRRRQLDQAALRVVGDRAERLVELMGQAAGHLADRGCVRDMAELLQEPVMAFLGQVPFLRLTR